MSVQDPRVDPLAEDRLQARHRGIAEGGLKDPIAHPGGHLPPRNRVPEEMRAFLKWFNGSPSIDPVLKAGLAHLWFVTIHPFEDGNGRIARAIADMALARSENSRQRFYSMSAQIRLERTAYYDLLEKTQKGDLDITPWLEWFLGCLDRAWVARNISWPAFSARPVFGKRRPTNLSMNASGPSLTGFLTVLKAS